MNDTQLLILKTIKRLNKTNHRPVTYKELRRETFSLMKPDTLLRNVKRLRNEYNFIMVDDLHIIYVRYSLTDEGRGFVKALEKGRKK